MSDHSTVRRDLCADLMQLTGALRNAQSEASLKAVIHAIRARTTMALDNLNPTVAALSFLTKDGFQLTIPKTEKSCPPATERERL